MMRERDLIRCALLVTERMNENERFTLLLVVVRLWEEDPQRGKVVSIEISLWRENILVREQPEKNLRFSI